MWKSLASHGTEFENNSLIFINKITGFERKECIWNGVYYPCIITSGGMSNLTL